MLANFNYQIEELIHESPRTLVYRGYCPERKRAVAIKLMRNEYPSFNELIQFRNQYTMTRNLNVEGIVKPYALERYENRYALILEDFGGVSLSTNSTASAVSSYSIADVLKIGIQLAEILHHVHKNRIIHKDIKPANILIHPQTQQVKLIDFSISSLLPKETQTLQTPNVLEGTLAYISPEQTGRMNRGIDYRSDFYSLGVSFYQLLTGKLPFESNDPMELIHHHIAQQPIPLQELLDETGVPYPETLSDIVLKLMAKNAEDRYQSALGLKYDLEKCLSQWEKAGKIEIFELGKRDICDRFLIPEKLYGREPEVQALLDAFNRVSEGNSELLLVAGYSGVGKTAVVCEVHKPIVAKRGYFIQGKFDQFQRNTPFSAFVQAFRDLMGQLLGESDLQLQQWRAKILETLGDNGRVIIEVIPELEKIIGKQPPIPKLDGNAAQNRFNLLFERFVGIFATKEHPLVVFLDDLQWADSASLNLLKLLFKDSNRQYLLAIGAYRDNEVFPAHPLILTLETLKQNQANLEKIVLHPLGYSELKQWVAETLRCPVDTAQPLTDLVFQKTKGNPFFTTQFLKGLYEEGLIEFELEARYWQCDLARVRELVLTEDVVAFMASRLQKFPEATQNALKLAACIGNQFDLETLAIVQQKSPADTARDLWDALQEGLILPQSETYKFYQDLDSSLPAPDSRLLDYKFLHDRVQQAAYFLIPDRQKESLHYRIGRLLLQNIPPEAREGKIFAIVGQLNYATTFLTQEQERAELAELNAIAARKARTATAYQASGDYTRIGLSLLGEKAWEQHYNLTLAFHDLAAELASLQGDFAEMERWVETIAAQTRSPLEQINACLVKIAAKISQKQPREAIAIALEALAKLGIILPESPTDEDIHQAIADVNQLLAGRDIESAIDLPQMSDPHQIAIVELANCIMPAAYICGSSLSSLVAALSVKQSIQYGNTAASAFGYAAYGLIACNLLQDPIAGVKFGRLALQLVSRLDAKTVKAEVLVMVSVSLLHRNAPVRDILGLLQEGYEAALEVGNLEFVGYAAHQFCLTSFWCAQPLACLERETRAYYQALVQFNQSIPANWCRIHWQSMLNLLGLAQYPQALSGEALEEEEFLPRLQSANDLYGLYFFNLYKLALCYLFDDLEAAQNCAVEAGSFVMAAAGSIGEPLFYFYDALTALALWRSQAGDRAAFTSSPLNQRVERNLLQLQQHWARYAPMNHQHKIDLVEAEKCRVLGEYLNAIELYDRAIASAKAYEYLQEEALANELAAQFYLEWGKEKFAALYLQEAYYAYARWGAKAKTDALEQRYPQLLAPLLARQKLSLTPSATLAASIPGTLTKTTSSVKELLDFSSFIKAARTLSETIQLDRAIANLMQVVMENAGAETIALMLMRGETLMLEAKINQGIPEPITLPIPVERTHALPLSLINTVKHLGTALVLDNASQNLTYARDAYIQEHQPRSILCLPLIVRAASLQDNRREFIGILYLENNQVSGAFTSDRVEVLTLLCSQAAISLENARLYQQAQQAFTDLQQAQLQLVQNEKMAALGNVVAGVAHEINNPVGFIAGNLTSAREYLEDLLCAIALYQQKYPTPDAEFAERLKELDLDFVAEDFPNLLDSMQSGCDRITNISTSLRTFSRTDTEKKVEFDLHDGIESTLLILKYRLQANENRPAIEILKNYGEIPPILCYPGQLNQVFMNILANAIDALEESYSDNTLTDMEPPQARIAIATAFDRPQNKIAVSIADNGKGMSEAVRSQIFHQGFTTKQVGKGTGLGMAIAQSIVVEKHGGSIQVKSQLGQGTEFIISLPR